jgi:hypothetical protein
VSRLRRALPGTPLQAQPPGYRLDLPADAVDAVRFEDLVARARGEREPARVSRLLQEAEALWRGPAAGRPARLRVHGRGPGAAAGPVASMVFCMGPLGGGDVGAEHGLRR